MDMLLKSLKSLALVSALTISGLTYAKGDKKPEGGKGPKDPKKMEEMIAKLTEENTKTRLENLETIKKAHHELIDKIYKNKADGAQELNGMWKSANLKDENDKKEFFKKVREKIREYKEKERGLHEEFRKNYLEKFDEEFKHRKDKRKHEFKKRFEQEKREHGVRLDPVDHE